MAKLCLKKTSKRVQCRTRYKVEHKVREHNRKKRRAAKKDPFAKGRGAHKKLIHVPNICPFKEDILKEVAAAKQHKEDERLRQRETWADEAEAAKQAKQAGATVGDLAADADLRQAVHDQLSIPEDVERLIGADKSLKTYYREFRKVVEASDVVLEVLDARDPLGTRCLQVEQAVLDAPGNKRLIIVLNKSDLVTRDNLDAWLKYLRGSFPTTAMKASTQTQKKRLAHCKFTPNQSVTGSNCVGASLLMSLLANYCRNKGIKTAITVGVVGMPNVGKSSIINSLKRGRACNVGALPGMTKTMQVVTLDSKIKLLDSPGIVMDKTSSATSALKNVIDPGSMRNPSVPAAAILARANKEQLMELYEVEDFTTPEQFLSQLAKRYGRQKKGGVPDQDTAARILVGDWNRGKIKYHTLPPEESCDTHVSAEIVQQMAEEFRVDDVELMEASVMEDLKKMADDTVSTLVTSASMEVETEAGDGVLPDNVSVTTGESKKKVRWRKDVKTVEKPDKEMSLAGNQKQNKAKKVQFKKLKKQQARTVRKTDNLADVLENFTLDPDTESQPGDAYDFNSMS